MQQNPALPSNAGDRYHFIYVARKLLDLLHPRTTLVRVEVEGIAEEDAAPEAVDKLLGVDLAEYFGGDTAANATRVEIVQVKYSPLHPDEAWTVARLTKRSSKNPRSSVIGRLAEAYQALRPSLGPSTALTAKFVSNQQLDPELRDKLALLQQTPHDLDIAAAADLLRDDPSYRWLDPVQAASGLDWPDFTAFVRALDLRELGSSPLASAETDLFGSLDQFTDQAEIYVGHLISEVQRAATPGERRTFRKKDVLAQLRLFEEVFLPAPAILQPVDQLFATDDVARVAKAIDQQESGLLIVHGVGGTGKTSTMQVLARDQADKIALVLYDCFAGGDGLKAGRERFQAKKFFTQLTNELDALLHTNVLATTLRDRDRLISLFMKGTEAAAQRAAAQGKRLVIAVDAADNAARQARRSSIPGEESFVPLLARLSLPANCVLVVTTRTENLADLALSGPSCVLTGFTMAETERHAQLLAPGVSQAFAQKLHARTNGNPRVQAAILKSVATAAPDDQDMLLEQRARTTIFEYFADAFPDRVSAPADRRAVALLLEATQPIDIQTAALILDRVPTEIRSLVQSLAFGLDLLPDGTVNWRDQDFLDFAHDELGPERHDTQQLLARFCLDHFDASPYARANVSRHAFDAALLDQLVDFWLSGDRLADRIRDAAPHNEGVLRDVSYALRAAVARQRRVDVLRLLSIAADLAQGRSVFVDAMTDFPDVAARQDFVASYLDAFRDARQDDDVARRYLGLAAAMATENTNLPLADELRTRGLAILRQPDRFKRDRRFNLHDVETLAAYDVAIDGLDTALDRLQAWTPQSAILPAYTTTVRRAARRGVPVDASLAAAKLPPPARAYAALGALASADHVDLAHRSELVEIVVAHFSNALDEDQRLPQRALAQAVEALMRAGDFDAARHLLPLWTPREPTVARDPDLRDFLRRTACDEVLHDRTFAPEKYKRPGDRDESDEKEPHAYRLHDSELEALRTEMQIAYPALLCRARAWATRSNAILADVRTTLPRWEERHWSSPPRIAANAVVSDYLEAVMAAPTRDRELVLQILAISEKELPLATRDIVRPAEILGADDRYLRESEDLIRAALNSCRPPAIGARDAVDRLLRLHRVACRFDATLATELFQTARLLAAGVDATIDTRVVALLDTAEAAMASGLIDTDTLLRLATIVEYGQQMDEESPHSRMDRALQLVARSDPGAATALAGLWDDDDRLDLRDGLLAVAKGAAFRSDAADGHLASFVDLATKAESGTDLLDSIISRRGDAAQATVLPLWSEFALRQRRTDRVEEGEAFLRRCAALGVTGAVTEPMRAFLDTARAEGVQRPQDDDSRIALPGDEEKPTFAASVASELASSPARGLAALLAAGEKLLRRLSGREAGQLFSAVAAELPSNSISSLLDAVERWRKASYDAVDVFQVLVAIMKVAPAGSVATVRAAAGRHLTTDTLRFLPHFFRAEAYDACRECWIGQEATLFDGVSSAIASELQAYDPMTLQLWVGRLAATLPPADAAALLTHILPRTYEAVPDPRHMPAHRSISADRVLIAALADCLGHARREVRWHAVHAIATMVGLLGGASIALLVDELADTSHPRWMTRREWLLFTLEHIAYRWPEVLVAHVARIATHALDPDFPHAKIRHHARTACLRVARSHPHALDAATRDALLKVNQPIGFTTEKHGAAGLVGRWPDQRDRPFYMDSTDTLPYWYDPLGDCFNVTSWGVAERAYRWIVERWGITDDICHAESKKRRWDWRLTSNDHGSEPSIETLHKYAERHGMLMAAGELIDTMPVVRRDRADDDMWTDWSKYRLQGADPALPSRLLIPPPLHTPDNYGVFATDFKTWREERTDMDFRREILSRSDADRVVVMGHREGQSGERSFIVRISSAMVPRETAVALAHAIESHDDTYTAPYDEVSYAIIVPDLEAEIQRAERYREDDEEPRGPFSLREFVVHAHQELPLQGRDPRWHNYARNFLAPSKWVMEQFGITRPDPLRLEWTKDATTVAACELWFDGEDSEHASYHAEGNRFWMNRTALQQLMVETGWDIITTVTIQRHRAYRYRERGEDDYDRGQTRAYLLSDLLS
jgi:hypothetical protein